MTKAERIEAMAKRMYLCSHPDSPDPDMLWACLITKEWHIRRAQAAYDAADVEGMVRAGITLVCDHMDAMYPKEPVIRAIVGRVCGNE